MSVIATASLLPEPARRRRFKLTAPVVREHPL